MSETIATEIIELYQKFGSQDYIGEPVSQIEHMCQSAQLAMLAGANNDIVLAAFLHDIGHLYEYAFPHHKTTQMEGAGTVDHEKLGGEYLLQKGFSEKIIKMVKSHVAAKRYLTYKHPDYYNKLSDASKKTLQYQGGVMTLDEAIAFENDKHFNDYILIRKCDDEAKQTNQPLPNLNEFKQMIIAHLNNENK